MKSNTLFVILILILGSCTEKKPFKPALEQIIFQLCDSLRSENENIKMLSIEFNSDRHERNSDMKIYISDCYASANIDGYAKIGNITIAIYNLKDDYYEIVNKNDITFFSDTIDGFKDTCILFVPKKQFFYSIHNENVIKNISFNNDFPNLTPIRRPKCQGGVTYTIPIDDFFYWDSIQAEKEVEFYRNRPRRR